MSADKSEPTPSMKIVKTRETPWADGMKRGHYDNQRIELGGLPTLRCGLWQLAPGKKSFPLHRHLSLEEALFVVSGRAIVRSESGDTEVGPGDYVAFPPGGPAHQLINAGEEPFVYFAASANPNSVDVVEYPATGKVAVAVGRPPAWKRFIFPDQQVDYFEGDPDA
jgi:uncharacterized cupin superfamily protein